MTKLNITNRKVEDKPGFPLSKNKTDWGTDELAKNAKGGTEMMKEQLFNRLPDDLRDYFQVICSRVRELQDKPRILWLHDLWADPEAAHLKDPESRKRFDKLVFVSNWQLQTYQMAHNIKYSESAVMRNAIDPIPDHTKPTDCVNLIYHTTPHRGLGLLVPAYEALAEEFDNIHLDVYSSFNVYGWPERDTEYESLFDICRNHPKITYHGAQPNSVVREALQKAHIFAYPSIWQETSCIAAIEAMSAKCAVVCPNLAALPETTSNFAAMYQFDEDHQTHANRFYAVLRSVIENVTNENSIRKLEFQKSYTDVYYNWDFRAEEWKGLLYTMMEGKK